MEEEKCPCSYHLTCREVYVHLSWCPQSYEMKEWREKPWYKRIFTKPVY